MAQKKATLILLLKDKASRGLTAVGEKLNNVGTSLTKVRPGFLAVGTAIAAVGTASLVAAGKIEQWRISFTTMLGSADRADILLNKIKQFAKETPFDLPQVVKGGRALLAFGVEADKIIPTMKSLGDVSAGLGVPMERLILNFGQVKAQAKLTGRELRDFAISGVPLLAELAKNLNKTEAEVQEMVSRGQIGFAEVEKAFQSLSGEGGRFANLMGEQMNSLVGKFSNVKDIVFQLAAEFGETLLPAAKSVLDVLIKMGEETLKIISSDQELISINEIALEQTERRIEALSLELEGFKRRRLFKDFDAEKDKQNDLQALVRLKNDLKEKVRIEKAETALKNKVVKQDLKRADAEAKGRTAVEAKLGADIRKIKEETVKRDIQLEKLKAQNIESTLQFISSLSQSNTKALAVIGKAAAIFHAKINTAQAVTVALKSFPPPINFVFAAAVAAAGAVQIAQIAGVNLQKGGIVQAQSGGVPATLAEGGRDEAVIPLDDDEAAERLSGLGGITINVGVLVGSEDNVVELAKMIDEQLFTLRRNNESVAFQALGS